MWLSFLPSRQRRRSPAKSSSRYLRWTLQIGLVLLALDLFYLILIWPNWDQFGQSPVSKSRFIQTYESRRQADKSLPPLRWQPVPLSQIPQHVQRAVIVAEDARFYTHHGIDLIAIREAMSYNLQAGQLKYGASTLSQQTIKNMFFSTSRNLLRKWHELILTLGMEFRVSKKRILMTYLNIAEFGEGIYGVESAARYYWGSSVASLNHWQAAQLAATLPSPTKHNPATRTTTFLHRANKIFDAQHRI
jgi:monofunctional biosynthetic peptidoglycan transglycosylase